MKKKIFEIKNRWTGKVLFEYKSENNTIKETVKELLKEYSGKTIKDIDLSNMNLSGISFDNSRFDNSSFYNSSFYNSRFYNSSFYNSRFDNSRFYNSSFYNSRFDNSSFYNSRFDNSRFDNSSFDNSSFYNSRFDNSRFYNSRFDNSRFDNSSKNSILKYKHIWQIIPEEGAFIAWKKLSEGYIAKLEIPAKAKRTCNIINRKCRASYVKTLQIIDRNSDDVKEMHGSRNHKTMYKVGRLTRPDKYDDDFLKDCTNGIHFFVTKQEAKDW
jgi:hypothetical protein